MPTTTIIRGGYDTWVASGSPTSRHPIDTRLRLQATTSYGYVYFPLGPELRGVTILSATYYSYGRDTGWGTQTLTARAITAAWDAGTLTWSNGLAVGATTATRTQTNPADLTEWPLDVTALVSEFAAGSRWRGMRLSLSDTVQRKFNSLNADRGKPRLVVVWTQSPAAPVDLSPAGGRAVSVSRPTLSWANDNSPEDSSFTDFEVQIDPAANGTTPAFASGTVGSTLAEYDLTQSAYVGLAAAATTQWRVRVRAGGLWSRWSDWASFTRVDKGTVSITTPTSTVAEYTPPVAWTTSFTQAAWQLRVFDDSIDSSEPRYDTGRKSGTTQDHTLPGKDPKTDRRVLVDGRSYRLVVRALDAVDREDTPGDPRFASAVAIFNYADDPTPNQVTSLVATQVGITPYVDLTWQRATTPDSWTILDNTKVVDANIPGADLLVSGTSYKYRYKDARPGAHDFKVKPTVNGLTAGSPTAGVTLNLVPNPSFEVDTTGWIASGAGATLARDTAQFRVGVASARLNSTDAGAQVYINPSLPVTPSTVYTASVYLRGTGTATATLAFVPAGADVTSGTVTLTSSWQRVTMTGTAPSGATGVYILVRQMTGAAQSIWVDAVMLTAGLTLHEYFDGSTAAGGGNSYAWNGTAHASSSTRTTLFTLTPSGVWVIGKDIDGADVDVFVAGKELGDFSMPDRGTTFDLPGSRTPVRVTQGVGGWRGTISGRLVNAAGQTTEQWRDRLLKLKRRGLSVTLFVGGEVIRAAIYDVNVDPSRDGGQTRAVSFEFFQISHIDWLD